MTQRTRFFASIMLGVALVVTLAACSSSSYSGTPRTYVSVHHGYGYGPGFGYGWGGGYYPPPVIVGPPVGIPDIPDIPIAEPF